MSLLEFAWRFGESRSEKGVYRHPGVVVLEFGGGSCNKSGSPSCRDFCAVPRGKTYDPHLDPPIDMLIDVFSKISLLKPAILSIVPNGEGVDTTQTSNTQWNVLQALYTQDNLKRSQLSSLINYFRHKTEIQTEQCSVPTNMTVAEKMALNIALGTNAGLNLSVTTNGSFLSYELLKLYRSMGLQTINLSYHPNQSYNPEKKDAVLEHLIEQANNAIKAGMTPTITHVLTRQNANTFVDLVDYITDHDILFAVGIANGRGGSFSTDNSSIEPTDEQLKLVFRRLLARKLFADRHIRTTIPYLIMAPYLRHWVCDQSTNFFHISIQQVNGTLKPHLNVCSEVRPKDSLQLENFLKGKKMDLASYLERRSQAMNDSVDGCPTCTHQCFFEAETRGGINISNTVELIDYWDTAGKALRQRYTFRHPIRPTVSKKADFQNPILWKMLLQGVTRQVAKLAEDDFWQNTFKRSCADFNYIIDSCIGDTDNLDIIDQLVESETITADLAVQKDWNDARLPQSIILRNVYSKIQKTDVPIPAKFTGILKIESPTDFQTGVKNIIEEQKVRRHRSTKIVGTNGSIFPMIFRLLSLLHGIFPAPLLQRPAPNQLQVVKRHILQR